MYRQGKFISKKQENLQKNPEIARLRYNYDIYYDLIKMYRHEILERKNLKNEI